MTQPLTRSDSRERLLAAAAAEFAAHGFDAANMDRLAAAAGLNKAMIYYHFASKAALYVEIFRDFLRAVLERVRAVAEGDAPPPEKIRRFVRAIADEADVRPHFPPMWLREVGGGGRQLDRDTLALVGLVPGTLSAIVAEGQAAGLFRPVHPLLLQFTIVGPLVLFLASEPIRAEIARAALPAALAPLDREDLIAHVQHSALATLAVQSEARRVAPSSSRPHRRAVARASRKGR